MKKCSCCRKEIIDNATVCRYCYSKQTPTIEFEIIMSTTSFIDGYEIIENRGIVNSEIVIPNGLMGAFTSGTFFTIDSMEMARSQAFEKICDYAKKLKANAIVGLDVDINDLNGHGILVSVNGTAVYVIQEGSREYHDKLVALKNNAEQERLAAEQERLAAVQAKGTNMDATINNLSTLESWICKLIIRNGGEASASNIMKLIPSTYSPTDISAALNNLLDKNILIKNAEGHYVFNG